MAMKYSIVAWIVIAILSSCSGSNKRVAELEEMVKQQAREIEQLRAAQTVQEEDDAVASVLRVRRKVCTKVKVMDDAARIYFCGMMGVAFFLENPEPQARLDLQLFLQKTGLDTGLIEYFTPQGEKIFAITGSLSSVETKSYH
jgi:hypothetical protein